MQSCRDDQSVNRIVRQPAQADGAHGGVAINDKFNETVGEQFSAPPSAAAGSSSRPRIWSSPASQNDRAQTATSPLAQSLLRSALALRPSLRSSALAHTKT